MNNKKLRKILIIILIIIVFVGGIFAGKAIEARKYSEDGSSTTTQISETTVSTQTIENTLTSSGEVTSSETEKLDLSTSKYFKTMCVEENDIVKKGGKILKYSDGTYLKADYDCLISSYSVPETGSKCTSSNYVEVKNMKTLQLNISVDETEINQIKKGQEVKIEISALDKSITGKITSVNQAGTYSNSGTTFSAVVEFENDCNAKIGMSASCTIVLEKAENTIAVPIEAVQTNNDKKYVVVVKTDGTTENVTIETGISNDSYVQATSGLSGGETIQMIKQTTNTTKSRRNSSKNNSLGGGNMQMPSGNFGGGTPPSGIPN